MFAQSKPLYVHTSPIFANNNTPHTSITTRASNVLTLSATDSPTVTGWMAVSSDANARTFLEPSSPPGCLSPADGCDVDGVGGDEYDDDGGGGGVDDDVGGDVGGDSITSHVYARSWSVRVRTASSSTAM